MEEVVITSAIRTPIGGFQGELECFSASDLGGMAIDGAMKQAGIDRVDEVIMGNVLGCLLYTSPSPRDLSTSRMPSSA